MSLAAAGYSGKPLHEKLGLRDGMAACFIALPAALQALTSAVTCSSVVQAPSWAAFRASLRPVRAFDFIHAFSDRRAEIEERLADLRGSLAADGMIWVSWPKKASKVRTDVTENVIREQALRLDLVDVKVAAVDETWSGLKFVIRKGSR